MPGALDEAIDGMRDDNSRVAFNNAMSAVNDLLEEDTRLRAHKMCGGNHPRAEATSRYDSERISLIDW